jgi:hypothetical protein
MSCAYAIPAASFIFEAFIREAFPFQQHLVGFSKLMFLLKPKGYEAESYVGLFFTVNTLRSRGLQYCRLGAGANL